MDEQKTGVISRLLRSPAPPATPEEYFAHLPTLATPRLILRRLTMRDAADVYEYARDREVARQFQWGAIFSTGSSVHHASSSGSTAPDSPPAGASC